MADLRVVLPPLWDDRQPAPPQWAGANQLAETAPACRPPPLPIPLQSQPPQAPPAPCCVVAVKRTRTTPSGHATITVVAAATAAACLNPRASPHTANPHAPPKHNHQKLLQTHNLPCPKILKILYPNEAANTTHPLHPLRVCHHDCCGRRHCCAPQVLQAGR